MIIINFMKKFPLIIFLGVVVILLINYFFPHLPEKNENKNSVVSRVRSDETIGFTNFASLSLEELFLYHSPQDLPQKSSKKYVLIATGDVLAARTVNYKMVQQNNFKFPFAKTKELLKSADILFINLETPLLKNCPVTHEGMIFCGDERSVEGLKDVNVDVVNIANNHSYNHGLDGVNETVELLEKNNFLVTGNKKPAILDVNDKKFGFLGYNDIGTQEEGITWADIPTMEKEINDLKTKVDFVIVQFHWGVEYVYDPSQRQRELGQKAIDFGADLIIGNHPHWVQGVEIYKDKLITYAHGNFVFDQMWSQETREGVVGVYTFNDKYLEDVKFYPVIIEDYVQPRFANETEAKKILDAMKNSTKRISESNLLR